MNRRKFLTYVGCTCCSLALNSCATAPITDRKQLKLIPEAKLNAKKSNNNDFLKLGKNKIKTIELNSIRDNKMFEINAVEILYSLPENSFTLINDEKNNIYLAKIKKFENKIVENDNDKLNEYVEKQKTNQKNSLLKSYDLLLNEKYNVTLNQKTIERVKNYFK